MIIYFNTTTDIFVVALCLVVFGFNIIMSIFICTECTRSSMIAYNKYKLAALENRVIALEASLNSTVL